MPTTGPANPGIGTAARDALVARREWVVQLADRTAQLESTLHGLGASLSSGREGSGREEVDAAGGEDLGGSVRAACAALVEARLELERLAADVRGLERASAPRSAQRLTLRRRSRPMAPSGRPVDPVGELLAQIARDLSPHMAARLAATFPRASPDALTVLADLVDEGLTHDQLVELLEGGHLLVPGHGLLDRWAQLSGAHPRTSSHYHQSHEHPAYGRQYGLAGPFVHEVLFGPGPHGTTFVQLERAAPSRVHLAEHIWDWVEYRATGRNQGPYGSSTATDRRPVRIAAVVEPESAVTGARLAAAAARIDEVGVQLQRMAAAIPLGVDVDRLVWRGSPARPDDPLSAPLSAGVVAALARAHDVVVVLAAGVRGRGAPGAATVG